MSLDLLNQIANMISGEQTKKAKQADDLPVKTNSMNPAPANPDDDGLTDAQRAEKSIRQNTGG